MIHLASPTRIHGTRCNRRGQTDRTYDLPLVTCSICRGLGPEIETAPETAMRVNTFMPVFELNGGDRGVLNLHNVLLVPGGSLLWFEEPNIVAVMYATEGGTVRRFEGEWEAKVAR